jgi:surfactin synthase thioesterase subunit
MSIQLFCIPYAGGKASVFNQLLPFLDEGIQLEAIEFSGHDKRAKEPFYQSFEEMVKDTANEINKCITSDRIAIFGYSMGSVVSFEAMLGGYLDKKPEYFFFASHEAPGEHWASMEYAALDDMEFFRKIVEFGGFRKEDEARLNNRFFRKLIYDPIRADYNLIGQYKLTDDKKLDIPATMMYSTNDVPSADARKWQNRFETEIEFIEMGTNHFFINDMPEKVAEIINNRI